MNNSEWLRSLEPGQLKAWFESDHGDTPVSDCEPTSATESTQTGVCTDVETVEPQEPRETAENACSHDSRECNETSNEADSGAERSTEQPDLSNESYDQDAEQGEQPVVVDCKSCAERMGAYADSLSDPLKEQMEKLLRCLENDYGIKASWDGLRKVWFTEKAHRGLADALGATDAIEWSQEQLENANPALVNALKAQDSREKLEADMKTHLYEFGGYCFSSREGHTDNVDTFFDDFIALLDRQEAITEREFIHSHPICGGSDTCHATNLLNSESVERETPQTAENATSKDEIRDFDVWSVAYEIYCAGGWVDNGNEPNPPTDGIWKLLDRQAAITRAECSKPNWDYCETCELQAKVNELTEERDYWKQEVQSCMDAAYPKSHSPERRYDPNVMAYPDRKGCTTPSTLVCDVIDGLREEKGEMYMGLVKELTDLKDENAKLSSDELHWRSEAERARAEAERYRTLLGIARDHAHAALVDTEGNVIS